MGHQGHHLLLAPPGPQHLGEPLLDMVADIALAHGPANVKGHGRGHRYRIFVLQHDAPHLGAVAVGHHHLVPLLDDVRNVLGGLLHHLQLGLGGGGLSFCLQGVASQGDHDLFHGFVSFV